MAGAPSELHPASLSPLHALSAPHSDLNAGAGVRHHYATNTDPISDPIHWHLPPSCVHVPLPPPHPLMPAAT